MYMEDFFFQDGVSRVWHDSPRSRMSGFFLIPEVRSTEATLVQHPCSGDHDAPVQLLQEGFRGEET